MPDPRERVIYDEEDGAAGGQRASRIGRIVAVLAVLGFGLGIWYVYDRSVRHGDLKPPPIVTADTGPIKSQPAEPGGMRVPNQASEILNQGGRNPGAAKVEQLLPPPERPLPEKDAASRPGEPPVPAAPVAAPPPAPVAPQQVVEKPASPPEPEKPAEVKEVAVEKKPEPAPVPLLEPKIAAAPPATPKSVPAPSAAVSPTPSVPAAAGGGGFRIQLASLPDAATADKEWARLQRNYPEVLGKLSPKIVAAEVAGKGTWYRIQAGPFADKAAAQRACDQLKQKKQGCYLASP